MAVPLLLLLDTLFAYLVEGWLPSSRKDRYCLISFVLALAIPGALCVVPAFRRLLARRSTHIAVFVAMLLVPVVGLELFLRHVHDPFLVLEHTSPPHMRLVYDPADRFPGVEGHSVHTTNDNGIRGPEFRAEADIKVLCVGGSTTECLVLDDSETWPFLLTQALGQPDGERSAWVGNAGKSGLSSRWHLGYLRNTALLDEVDVVVLLIGMNDFVKAIQARPPIWARSRIPEVIRTMRRFKQKAGGSGNAPIVRGRGLVRARQARAQGARVDQLPDLGRALDEYGDWIEKMVAVCEERGVRPVFCTQPVLWTPDMPQELEALCWFGWVQSLGTGSDFYSSASLRAGIESFNDRLRETCARLGLEFVDLSDLSGRAELFYDDCHFNELGAREVARHVAKGLGAAD